MFLLQVSKRTKHSGRTGWNDADSSFCFSHEGKAVTLPLFSFRFPASLSSGTKFTMRRPFQTDFRAEDDMGTKIPRGERLQAPKISNNWCVQPKNSTPAVCSTNGSLTDLWCGEGEREDTFAAFALFDVCTTVVGDVRMRQYVDFQHERANISTQASGKSTQITNNRPEAFWRSNSSTSCLSS